MMYVTVLPLLFVFAIVSSTSSSSVPCFPKLMSGSSFVCVCNATYCDTVEPETPLQEGQYAVYSSSMIGARLNKSVRSFEKSTGAQLWLAINDSETKQTILGFGGTFTDAAGMNIDSLPDDAQTLLIESYFGSTGIEYTLGRIPIASNDMSTDEYSYDFTIGDTGLSKFTIAGYDHLYKIPYIDKAVLASPHNVSLYGSPWAPPDWMKSNDDMSGYGTVTATNMSKVYANYVARFLSEYEGFMLHGRMWGLTTQSGPSRSCNLTFKPVYQSLCWTSRTMHDWIIKDLKQSIIDQGYAHIKLFTMDDNRDVLTNWTETFNDAAAVKDIDGFAVQGYHDDHVPPGTLCKTYDKYGGTKLLLGSEFCIRETPVVDLGNWKRGETLARRIFQDLQNCISGFTDYNLAVNLTGGPSWANNNADSPIIVDKDQKVFYKQPMFYTMGQFSKFIHPRSIAIGLKSSRPISLENPAVAFQRTDNSIVVVVGNFANTETDIEIMPGHDNLVMKYRMSANSIHTFICRGDK